LVGTLLAAIWKARETDALGTDRIHRHWQLTIMPKVIYKKINISIACDINEG